MKRLQWYNKVKVCILLSFAINHGFAQQPIPQEIPTPTAASIAKYGDIPVSHYTGRANVSIPLFSTEVRGMPLNLSLDYDTSGLLVNSLPGWVGQNWTLNAGGVITRSVVDRADELIYPHTGDHYVVDRGPITTKYIEDIPNYFNNYYKLPTWINDENVLKDSIASLCGDLSPDIFTFNFMGKSGKFFLGNDGQWKVASDENLDIIFDINNQFNYVPPVFSSYPVPVNYSQPNTIKGFHVKDGEGFSYYFGYYPNEDVYIWQDEKSESLAIDYSLPFAGFSDKETSNSWIASSWYLTEIRDKYDNVLYQFFYDRGEFISQFFLDWCMFAETEGATLNWMTSTNSSMTATLGSPFTGTLNSPVYLFKIKCKNNINIDLRRSTDKWRQKINSMDIYPGLKDFFSQEFDVKYKNGNSSNITMPYYYLQTNDEFIKKYQYNPDRDLWDKKHNPLKSMNLYNLGEIDIYKDNCQADGFYWSFSYENENRNMLKEIRQTGYNTKYGVNDAGELYEFEYYDYSKIPKDYLTSAVDHYGYYNGNEYMDVCTGIFNVDLDFGHDEISVCREPNEECMKMGMLKTITYPTGGTTTFEYEANRYLMYKDKQMNCRENGITGGLRVKSISDCIDTTVVRRKSYRYDNGILYAKPKYVWADWTPITEHANDTYSMCIAQTRSIIPLVNSFGSHIGYSNVTEINMDGSYSQYVFSNYDTINDEPAFFQINRDSPYDNFSEKGYMRGKPLSSVIYSKDNKIQSTTNYYYCEDKANDYFVFTSNMFLQHFISGCRFFTGGIYKLYYPKYDVIKKDVIHNYDNGTDTITNKYIRTNYSIPIYYPYVHFADIRLLSEEHQMNNNDSQFQRFTYQITSNNMKCPQNVGHNK